MKMMLFLILSLGLMSCEALKRMMPYFKNKQQVAELGLELQATMQSNKQQVSDEVLLYRTLLKDRITHLNSLD